MTAIDDFSRTYEHPDPTPTAATPQPPVDQVGDEEVLAASDVPGRKGLTYFHVDDQDHIREKTASELEAEMEITLKLGEASSAEEAIRKIEALATSGKVPNVIILDQSFFFYEDDQIASKEASEEFITKFSTLVQKYPALKGTSIVMYSGTADEDYLREMQHICPQVIGLAKKTGREAERCMQIVGILADAGKIRPDSKVESAQERLHAYRAEEEVRAALERDH